MESMTTSRTLRGIGLAGGCVAGALVAFSDAADAGGFGVHEQSTTFLGSAFAGAAAGGDISSMYWNPAATAVLPGCSALSSYTLILGSSDETADSGLFATGPASRSADVAADAIVPASYLACQLSDRLYVGLALNSPFGLLTKPDDLGWAGSPIAVTSRVFTANFNPTVAYKITPALTLGAGLQVEYFRLRLNHAAFSTPPATLVGPRSYEADDWGVGATAGLLWQPLPGTSIGLGYRSAVGLDVKGGFTRGPGLLSPPAVATDASADLTLPEQATLSFRQAVAPGWAVLGTVEWQKWSRLGDVAAVGPGCGSGGVCEVLNLNYRDTWFYALGAEYAYSQVLREYRYRLRLRAHLLRGCAVLHRQRGGQRRQHALQRRHPAARNPSARQQRQLGRPPLGRPQVQVLIRCQVSGIRCHVPRAAPRSLKTLKPET
jgi:long-chain fatty acid transport protein